jgi:hypothetical protein
VLIGLFLSGGDQAKLRAHEIGGNAVAATGIFAVVASIIVWRMAKWPAKAVAWCLLLVVAEIVQLSMGYERHLGIHVPLGVFLAITASFLELWVYKPHGETFELTEKVGNRVRGAPTLS